MERTEIRMKIAIVGGGLGGMAAALTVAKDGHEVHIYEKNNYLGGKMVSKDINHYHFDFGPNTITMPHVFKEVLAQTGVNPDDYIQFVQIEKHLKNVSANGELLYFSSNINEMVDQLAQFSAHDAKNYPKFIQEITRMYQLSEKHFLTKTFFKTSDYLNPMLGAALLRVKPFQTLEQFFKKYFEHPFVLQCFNRYATYIGSSPYAMPATFAMIAYLELVQGVYYVNGGTSSIAQAFHRRLEELGVHIHLNSEVTDVYSFKYRIHTLEINGEVDPHIMEEYDAVIVNLDVLQYKKMLNYRAVDTKEPTTSALVALIGLNKRNEDFHHHNVYFTNNYKKEFEALFSRRYAENSSVYICNTSYTDKSVSPNGDNLLVLINAPALTKGNKLNDVEAKELILSELKKHHLNIEAQIEVFETITPSTIQAQFAAFSGALYGQNSNTKSRAFFRPRNRHPLYTNLYFVGGTVHPGGGSPLVVLGGMQVGKRILKEHKRT